MAFRQKKIEIVYKIIAFAKDYKEHLLGNTFMFVFDNRYIEVSFRKDEFAHLTGVDKTLSAKKFFDEAIRGTLRDTQISFSTRHPYKVCAKKMGQLQYLAKALHTEGFVLENIVTNSATYKFGFTEMNFTLCLGEDIDNQGERRSDYFIAQSFRVEDAFTKSEDVYALDYILKKKNTEKYYNQILLGTIDEDSLLPENIKDMLAESLIKDK